MTEPTKDRILVALAVLCIVLAIALGKKEVGGFNPDLPPKQYRGDATLKVDFTRHASTLCSIVKAEPGSIACAGIGSDWAIMPNPCGWSDPYARMMCHEIGHANGWGAEHGR